VRLDVAMLAARFLGRWALWAYKVEGSVVGTLRPSFLSFSAAVAINLVT